MITCDQCPYHWMDEYEERKMCHYHWNDGDAPCEWDDNNYDYDDDYDYE